MLFEYLRKMFFPVVMFYVDDPDGGGSEEGSENNEDMQDGSDGVLDLGENNEDNAFGIVETHEKDEDDPDYDPDNPDSGKEKEWEEKEKDGNDSKTKDTDDSGDKEVEQFIKTHIEPHNKEVADKLREKNFKSVADLAKSYTEMEASFTKRSQAISSIRKQLEGYAEIDENGNIQLTDKGQELLASGGKPKGDQPSPKGQETIDPQELNQKFFEKFEENPLQTLIDVVSAIAKEEGKNVNQAVQGLRNDLKPYFDKQESDRLSKMIDEVAEIRVKEGDTSAHEFVNKYGTEIAEALEKVSPGYRTSDPKGAIRQAYLEVYVTKIAEFKKEFKTKTDEAIKQEQDNLNNLNGGTGTVEGNDTGIPEFDAISKSDGEKDGSVFFT